MCIIFKETLFCRFSIFPSAIDREISSILHWIKLYSLKCIEPEYAGCFQADHYRNLSVELSYPKPSIGMPTGQIYTIFHYDSCCHIDVTMFLVKYAPDQRHTNVD